MSDDRYRRLVRAGLAPWVEEVPEGREWSELEEVSPTVQKPRRRVPGWVAAVGAAATVLAIFGVTSLLPPGEETPTASTTPTVTSGAIDSEPPFLEHETNSVVYFSTDHQLTVVEVDAGTAIVHDLPELAPGDPLYRLVRRGERFVFYGQTDTGPAVYSLDSSSPTSPSLIDDNAWFVIPSAIEDRVWIADLDESSPDTIRTLESVREVTVDGTVTTSDVAPPEGQWPVAAVDDGLVFQGDDILEIWDPETQEFVETLPGSFPVAAWGNRIVTCGECDQLELVDLDAGTQRTIDIPAGVAEVDGYGGAFSPDGRYVAVPASLTEGPLTAQTELAVVLVDFETGGASVIPGTLTENRFAFPGVAWSPNGEWLFMGPFAVDDDRGELRAYRPGDATAYRVPIDLENEYFGMAAG